MTYFSAISSFESGVQFYFLTQLQLFFLKKKRQNYLDYMVATGLSS